MARGVAGQGRAGRWRASQLSEGLKGERIIVSLLALSNMYSKLLWVLSHVSKRHNETARFVRSLFNLRLTLLFNRKEQIQVIRVKGIMKEL